MSSRLIGAISRLGKVCEQINLPVQSGSNDVLEKMRRGYTVEQYRQLVSQIRSEVPGVSLSTDVIVGFPSESRREFRQTFELLSELRFDTVHVAAYSPRSGTVASRELTDSVPFTEKKERLNELEQLQEGIATEINARLSGQAVEVMVESKAKEKWQGRTRTGKIVFFTDGSDRLGQLLNIRVEKTSPWSLQGKIEANTANN